VQLLFNSFIFAVYMVLFAPVFLLARKNVTARNALLIVASYIFYGWWDWRFLVLVAISTAVDYAAAIGASGKPVERADLLKSGGFMAASTLASIALAQRDWWIIPAVFVAIAIYGVVAILIERGAMTHRRARWLAVSLITNLSILGFFKYFNFFAHNVQAGLGLLGLHPDFVLIHIILPVGLSFYTFQAISRTIDSYRGVFDPQRSIVNYAAYHAFFPQLVAGPIERARHLMPQFERPLPITRDMVETGILWFAWGLWKKMAVADTLAPIANNVFNKPMGHSAGEYAAACLAFTFQIYCDFSGYSDMARGLARCLGFDLMVNFRIPYLSTSPSEFWRRWHISLSSWLRDYVYIPLGGNRGGAFNTYRNLFLTMLIGGLWHGASWTFVAWGAIHGAIQVVFKLLDLDGFLARSKGAARALSHVGAWALTFFVVVLAWIMFRASDFATAATVARGTFGFDGWTWDNFLPIFERIAPLFAVDTLLYMSERSKIAMPKSFVLRYNVALCLVMATIVFSAVQSQQFIYFDF